MAQPVSTADVVAATPKTDLHVHLVGSASPATVGRLAERHPRSGVPPNPAELAAWLQCRNFTEFASVFGTVSRLVTGGADIVDLVDGLGAELGAHRVRYAEVTVTPAAHLDAGIEPAVLGEALAIGAARVAAAHGIELSWIFDISGELGVPSGERTLDWIRRHGPVGTVALGLGGPEVGVDRRDFAPLFAEARSLGLRSVPHAGEHDGPASVWAAVGDLGAHRIGHGIRSIEDADLVAHLAATGIPLEVCVTSNLTTGAVASLDRHPLPRLLDAGVRITLGTDDPGIFSTDLTREYRRCHDEIGLGRRELVGLIRTGIDAAFCSDATRRRLRAELDACLVEGER